MDYLSLAFVLVVVGVILLAAEVLIPTGGLLIVGALLFFAVAVGTIIRYGDAMQAALALGGLAVGLPVAGYAMVAAWRRLAIGNAVGPVEEPAPAADPGGLNVLRGRHGKTVSPMRPGGAVVFDGRRVDALTEGMMLDAGVWVRCVDVKGGRVVVRQLDVPPDEELQDVRPDAPAGTTAAVPPPTRDDLDDLGIDLPPK